MNNEWVGRKEEEKPPSIQSFSTCGAGLFLATTGATRCFKGNHFCCDTGIAHRSAVSQPGKAAQGLQFSARDQYHNSHFCSETINKRYLALIFFLSPSKSLQHDIEPAAAEGCQSTEVFFPLLYNHIKSNPLHVSGYFTLPTTTSGSQLACVL